MNIFKTIALKAFVIFSIPVFSQVGGNQVYRNHHTYGNSRSATVIRRQTMVSTDSTLTINAHILLNKRADHFMITVGVHQEGATVVECNSKINSRISNLKKDFAQLEISEEDLYVDFVSQTKIYDYEVSKTESVQLESGFEIKKNIIFKVSDISKMDRIVELCAKQEVFDIINVEYFNDDTEAQYEKLYEEAITFINRRKNLYLKTSSQKLNGNFRVVYDNFHSLYPKSRYVEYTAFESAGIQVHKNYSTHYVTKEKRKHKTYFYEGAEIAHFDKVINNNDPEVGIQYILTISMVYEVDRSGAKKASK